MADLDWTGVSRSIPILKKLCDQIGKSLTRYDRRKVFAEHIVESFETISEIHNDYHKSFSLVISKLERQEDLKECISFLRISRSNLISERNTIKESIDSAINTRIYSGKKDEFIDELYRYARSIEGYISCQDPASHSLSWYSDTITMMSAYIELGKDPFSQDYPVGGVEGRAPHEIVNHLAGVPEKLEKRFQKVSSIFFAMKVKYGD